MTLMRMVIAGCVALDDAGLALPRWLRKVRPLAAHAGITGGLLFDGERWLQLLEGDAAAVDRMLQGLRQADPPLGDPQVLLAANDGTPQRLSPGWLIGYVEPEDVDRLHERFAAEGPAALPVFVRVLVGSDPG